MTDPLLRLMERIGARLPASMHDHDKHGPPQAEAHTIALFEVFERCTRAADEVATLLNAATNTADRERVAMETARDHARHLDGGERQLTAASARAREALEQVRLVALNAGLEGLRLGEPTGKALVTVAEELRTMVQRGIEALDGLSGALGQFGTELNRLREDLSSGCSRGAALLEELRRARAVQDTARHGLGELAETLESKGGVHRELASRAGAAAEHARKLAEALDALLGAPGGRELASIALAPTLDVLGAIAATLRTDHDAS